MGYAKTNKGENNVGRQSWRRSWCSARPV